MNKTRESTETARHRRDDVCFPNTRLHIVNSRKREAIWEIKGGKTSSERLKERRKGERPVVETKRLWQEAGRIKREGGRQKERHT